MKKALVLVCALTSFFSFAASAQVIDAPVTKRKVTAGATNPPFMAIKNGEEIHPLQKRNLDLINPEIIKSVDVLKGQNAIDTYGEKAQFGAVILTLNDGEVEPLLERIKQQDASGPDKEEIKLNLSTTENGGIPDFVNSKAFFGYYVKGKIRQLPNKLMSEIPPSWIQSVEVYKGKASIKKVGKAAKEGAVILTIKPEYQDSVQQLLEKATHE